MSEEILKDVKGYEGLYKVSNLGRVKSLDRRVVSRGGTRLVKGKLLKNNLDHYGYLNVTLSNSGKTTTKKVHKLVAIAFLNHTPCGSELVVNHIDINKTNNNVENLEIVTTRENSNQKHLKSSSKYVGVHWKKSRNKWQSTIRINGVKKHLGSFDCEIEAHQAYQKALKEIS